MSFTAIAAAAAPVVNKLFDFIVDLFKDDDDIPAETRKKLEQELEKKRQEFSKQVTKEVTNLQKTLFSQQAAVIIAEVQSDSKLTKNWRPITMLAFVVLILLDSFTYTSWLVNLPEDVWEVLQYGLAGYIGGRSLEKTFKNYSVAKSLARVEGGKEKKKD